MYNSFLYIITALCFLGFSSNAQDHKVYLNERVEALWKSSDELKTPESVYYYKKLNVIFVSNINGNPLEKDNNGFISKLTPDGNIVKLEWVKGLNAPKGMGVYKNRLFVTDIDRIAEIDLDTEQIVKYYNVPEAKFLNDIAIDQEGGVYVSDMQANIVYKLDQGVVKKWLSSKNMIGPNGLSISKEWLFIGTKDRILKVDLKKITLTDYILNTGSIDGLICFESNKFIYSDWSGNVYFTALGKETEKLLDTTPLNINAADLGFDRERKIIFVPTFNDNRVMAYKIKY